MLFTSSKRSRFSNACDRVKRYCKDNLKIVGIFSFAPSLSLAVLFVHPVSPGIPLHSEPFDIKFSDGGYRDG